jgi:hypothetical protein
MALRSITTVIAVAGYALLLADGMGWWPLMWSIVTELDSDYLPSHMPNVMWGWTLGLTILATLLRLVPGRNQIRPKH